MTKLTFNFLVSTAILIAFPLNAQEDVKKALILIDIQEFYFPGGFSELHKPEEAAKNAAKILYAFREKGVLIVHVQHKTKEQMAIHELVKPLDGEKIVVKTEVSCFNGTGLAEDLLEQGITEVIIVGMQTHMCVEGAARAAYDIGLKVNLIADACTTKELKWEDKTIPWDQVHYSTLNTLKSYASIYTTDEYLTKVY